MAQLLSVKLSRFDSVPWGFRLQGGKDFAAPLVIQKVNGNSPAEKAGLQAGDALIRVNNVDLFSLSHKDAQNALVQAGNNFELTIQRGGSTWKPSVTPVGPAATAPTATLQPVTKTSLAYKGAPAPAIGSQHNTAAKPFSGAAVNGESGKSLASKLYNSPVGLYSEETIAETLSAQTEVLAGGVLGVNFKKNEKTYNAANSEVLKMVQEIDNEPYEAEPAAAPPASAPGTPRAVPVTNPLAGLRHVAAPETRPAEAQDPLKVLPPGQNMCADCERLIVGLFVRIKDKNLHVECFKCATCGTSLKNVGYYNISNKLYCDVHAKLAAQANPPGPNLYPVTLPPGIKPPSSVIGSALSSAAYQPVPSQAPYQPVQTPYQPVQTPYQPAPAPAPLQPFQSSLPSLASPSSPLASTLGPLPFHASQSGIRHVSAPRSAPYQPQAPPPSSQVSAPFTQAPKLNFGQPAPAAAPAAPRPLSESQGDGAIQYQSYSTVSQSSFASASASASQSVSYEGATESSSYEASHEAQTHKKMSICSQEIDLHMDAQAVVKQLSEILEEQDRCASPTPMDQVARREKNKQQDLLQWHAKKNLTLQGAGLAFLRSHSTPVAELEQLYEQQQREIEHQQNLIQKLGVQKRMSLDLTQIQQLESQIIESQIEIEQKQKKQEEIEKKKRVRFEEEEQFRRASCQVEGADVQQLREERSRVQEDNEAAERKQREQQALAEERAQQEQRRKEQEAAKRRESEDGIRRQEEQSQKREEEEQTRRRQEEERQHALAVQAHHDRARTPVADLEAYERHDGMSRKTETIYHTYEHLVETEGDEPAKETRPVTPLRSTSPFPGSIPSAEKNLLLKNIQGIQFEFELNTHTKPEPKTFKLPDLRNLSNTKPYTPARHTVPLPVVTPSASVPAPVPAPPAVPIHQTQAPPAAVPRPQPVAPPPKPQVQESAIKPVLNQQEILQRQIKEQRKQVHEELALNERFRKKQERLDIEQQRFERAKTPVAELEEEARHMQASERTQHLYESYDQVLQTAERPRSRIGQPSADNQSITDAEKSLFFQNISGINYEFENISELTATKHLPVEQKSVFIRDVEQRTQSPATVGVNDYTKKAPPVWTPKPDPFQSQFVQALTTMPDPAATASRKTYEQFRNEQESLYQKQKQEQQKYFEQQQMLQNQGLGSNKPKLSPLVTALTIAPDRPYSPLPSVPAADVPYVSLASAPPPQQPAPAPTVEPPVVALPIEPLASEAPGAYDNTRRRSSGFPGVNVQRTPYQMLRGSQIQSSFIEDLVTQQSAISQFLSETEESVTKLHRKDTIDASFGLIPSSSQIAYAPPPPPAKRAELVASQSQFGPSVDVKPQPHKEDGRALQKPISLTEALTIAPDHSYGPFAEGRKHQATLIHGGSAVALNNPSDVSASQIVAPPPPPPIQIKPNYEVRDLQLNKSAVKGEYTGFVEESKATSAEGGVIEGPAITGSYQKQQQSTSSTVQLEKLQMPTSALAPITEQDTPKTSEPLVGFPLGNNQIKAEFSQLKESGSSEQSSVQTEQVQVEGNVTRTTKRRVVEVAESSHREVTQVRVVGGSAGFGGVDPISGLRRTSNEVVGRAVTGSSYQAVSSSGLQKATSIPTYQNQLSEKPTEPIPAVPAAKVDSKDLKPRPRSAVGGRVAAPEPTKVPTAFRSRTPVPLPKVEFPPRAHESAPFELMRKNLPTYNQDQVYRSASPRPIPVPRPQSGSYAGPQPHHSVLKPASTAFRTSSPLPVPSALGSYRPTQPQQSTLKPAAPAVYRSTSPVPVPKMVKTNETYQQPISSWRVQPVKPEKRVSWPPKEESIQLAEIPVVTSQTSVMAKVSQQEEQAQKNIEEARRSSVPSSSRGSIDSISSQPIAPQKSVKAMISQQEQQAQINIEEARRSSLVKSAPATERRPSEDSARRASTPLTSLVGKGQQAPPGPKHDPIVAPRPFGTPTPQRKLATPHFQPITPVAITQGQNAPLSAPKLTFSSSLASAASSVERKTSLTLTGSSVSAFKPLDSAAVVPVKPVACRPTPALAPVPAPLKAPPSAPPSTPPASLDNGADAGAGGARGATFSGVSAPRRGRGVLNPPNSVRVPLCAQCNGQVRGPFITALGKIWCPDHFVCATAQCRRPLADIGFVEEQGQLHCEFCFEKYLAPNCDKCSSKIKGDCLNAVGKHFHPECFTCAYCSKLFGNSAFFLEDGLPYCENDWNELFTTKCFACGFPIEAGDKWVEALNNNYHSQCFNCTVCKKNLEGQSFFAKGGRPFCKAHAR